MNVKLEEGVGGRNRLLIAGDRNSAIDNRRSEEGEGEANSRDRGERRISGGRERG